MKDIVDLMSSYGSYHTKQITKLTHFVGVPSIVFALMIALCWFPVQVGDVTLVWIVVFVLLGYYIFLDMPLGLFAGVFFIPLTYIAQLISDNNFSTFSLVVFLFFFIFGWVVQLIGHHYEGNRPAFLDNVFQVFVAPLFLVAELAFFLGFRKELQQKVLAKNQKSV